MRTVVRSEFGGYHQLPKLTDEEREAFRRQQFHKLRKSKHVQAMESLINESHSVPPDEVDGAVLYYSPEDQGEAYPGYALLMEDEDGDLYVKIINFIGSSLDNPFILVGMTKEELVKERFTHVPPRSVL